MSFKFGFCSFADLLGHTEIQKAVQDEGKVLVVETKRPGLKVKRSGGFFARKKHDLHMGKTMNHAEQLLNEYEIPIESIVHYACLLYTSPSPRDGLLSRMPSSA